MENFFRSLFFLALLVFSCSIVVSPSFAQQYLLDFDDLDEGVVFSATNQAYQELDPAKGHGVSISGGGNPTVTSTYGSRSSPNALFHEIISEFGSINENLEISLNGFTSDYARVFVGLPYRAECQVTAHLLAFDQSGAHLDHAEVQLGHGPLLIEHELVVESEDGAIASLVLSYGYDNDFSCEYFADEASSEVPELIDSLLISIWEGEAPILPEDTVAPVVNILSPSDGDTVDHGVILGYVEEAADPEVIRVDSEAGDSIIASIYHVDPFEEPRRHYFVGNGLPLSPGDHTLTVTAYDPAGNSGNDNVSVTYEQRSYPPPPPEWPENLDIKATGMEVTQVIQDWDMIDDSLRAGTNRAHLVAGKKTLVRVYAEATGTEIDIPGLGCELFAYSGHSSSEELPGSPIRAINSPTLIPGENHLEQRLTANKSFNFVLPPEWTQSGNIRLTARVNPYNGVPETDYDVYNNVTRDITFYPTDSLIVNIYSICSRGMDNSGVEDDYAPTWSECVENLSRLRQIYPISPDKISLNLAQRLETDIVVDKDLGGTDDDFTDLLHAFRRYLGFYYVIISPSTPFRGSKNVYLGLVDDGNGAIRLRPGVVGITAWRRAVALSGAHDQMTTAHELGHCEGLGHVRGCNDPASPYEDYEVYRNLDGSLLHQASIGDWGVDVRHDNRIILKDPADHGDIMSYCPDSTISGVWMSLYTWEWLFDHFNDTSGLTSSGINIQAEIGKQVPYLYIGGSINSQGELSLDPTLRKNLPSGTSDHIGKGDYYIQLLDKSDEVLFERKFTPDQIADYEKAATFFEVLPAYTNTAAIVVGGKGIKKPYKKRAGQSEPVVRVISPNYGKQWPAAGKMQIQWNGSDPDGDSLTYTVFYSNNNGTDWTVIGPGVKERQLTVNLEDLPGGTNSCLVRVLATDGINQGKDTSDIAFTKIGQAPYVGILKPDKAASFVFGERVLFEGVVTDREDKVIPEDQKIWSSNRDGTLGNGNMLDTAELSPGFHLIEFTARDSENMKAQDSVPVFIRLPEVTPYIKVNDSDEPIKLGQADPVTVSLGLNAGNGIGLKADWWLLMSTPVGLFHLDILEGGWQPGFEITDYAYQGPLFGIPMVNILNFKPKSKEFVLPKGDYIFLFGVDFNPNGSLDLNQVKYDYAELKIK